MELKSEILEAYVQYTSFESNISKLNDFQSNADDESTSTKH